MEENVKARQGLIVKPQSLSYWIELWRILVRRDVKIEKAFAFYSFIYLLMVQQQAAINATMDIGGYPTIDNHYPPRFNQHCTLYSTFEIQPVPCEDEIIPLGSLS